MANLTKKQQSQLELLDKDTLLDIVQQIAHDNARIRAWLVNGWLSNSEDVGKRLATDYARKTKSNRFYDYYEADGFFEELQEDIVKPLALHVEKAPAQVEALAAKMLLDFERLSGQVDTSSGSWQEYTSRLFDIWLRALSLQKTRPAEDIAQAIFTVAQNYDWFNVSALYEWRSELGNNVLQLLAGLFIEGGEVDHATTLHLMLRDIDKALDLIKSGRYHRTGNTLKLAELLIDELRAAEAIALLHDIEKSLPEWSADFTRWGELLISALLEEGLREQAKETILNAFARSVSGRFWPLWLKAGGDEKQGLKLFLQRAGKADNERAVIFLAEIEQYALLSDIITDVASAEITIRLPEQITGSFWRTLSSTLYKQGYAKAAVVLRRRLAEYSISRASSRYYTYAANDAKKAVDYCIDLELSTDFINSQSWLQSLYKMHFRKYSLWNTMQEKIAALKIDKEQGLLLQK